MSENLELRRYHANDSSEFRDSHSFTHIYGNREGRPILTLRRLLLAFSCLLGFHFFGRLGGQPTRTKPESPPVIIRRPFRDHNSRKVPPSFFKGPANRNFRVPTTRESLSDIFDEADALIDNAEYAHVQCHISAEHRLRFMPLFATKEHILIVASYSDSANVLLTVLREVVALASFLGPERVHVAITEGGSKDQTPELLHLLARALTSIGASFSIRSDGDSKKPAAEHGNDRIRILAEARNWPLDHLEGPVARAMDGFDAVLLMNDITFCAVDAIELIYQRLVQDADAICALDYNRWVWTKDRVLAFYDTWVSRTIDGRAFWDVQPSGNFYDGTLDFDNGLLVNSPASKARYHALLPFQVFTCWNGALVVRAEPLQKPHRIRLRALPDEQVSESYVFIQDLWMAGFSRIAVAPRARVGYAKEHYDLRGMVNETRDIAASHTIEAERVSEWQTVPPAVVEMFDKHSFWSAVMRPWNWLPDGVDW